MPLVCQLVHGIDSQIQKKYCSVEWNGSRFDKDKERDVVGVHLSDLFSWKEAVTSFTLENLNIVAQHDFLDRLLEFIRNNPTLEVFAFTSSSLTDDDVNGIIGALKTCKNLREVNFKANSLTAETLQHIAELSLQKVSLSENNIGVNFWDDELRSVYDIEGLEGAVEAWKKGKAMESLVQKGLDLSDNFLLVPGALDALSTIFDSKVNIGTQKDPVGASLSANSTTSLFSEGLEARVFFPNKLPLLCKPNSFRPISSGGDADGEPPPKRQCGGSPPTKVVDPTSSDARRSSSQNSIT